jgi:hypothetical protein
MICADEVWWTGGDEKSSSTYQADTYVIFTITNNYDFHHHAGTQLSDAGLLTASLGNVLKLF